MLDRVENLQVQLRDRARTLDVFLGFHVERTTHLVVEREAG
jgi:hypothetical protein